MLIDAFFAEVKVKNAVDFLLFYACCHINQENFVE